MHRQSAKHREHARPAFKLDARPHPFDSYRFPMFSVRLADAFLAIAAVRCLRKGIDINMVIHNRVLITRSRA
jgi:hypothetical protein